jgi:dipeptidyl-peptidase-4
MTRSTEFRAGIAGAPVTDWHFYDTRWTESVMERPQENPEGYRATSLLESAKDLHGKLLLVFGTYDDNVHPQNEWAFADRLIEAGKTYRMVVYPMRKHGFTDVPAQAHLWKTMLEFWEEDLAGRDSRPEAREASAPPPEDFR